MKIEALFPQFAGLHICTLALEDDGLSVTLQPKNRSTLCPLCKTRTHAIHSHYQRTLLDLPLCGMGLRLHLQMRRFRCNRKSCARKIFCERLPFLTQPYARTTTQQAQLLQILGMALGGNAGARISAKMHRTVSASTLLRRIQAIPDPKVGSVRVLGVDDWALKKGQNYATILCDLQQGCPIALLPERSAQSLTAWLVEHPEIEIISRDRGGIYAEGAREGAPQAQQVADRFHLIQNLAQALKKILDRHSADLKAVCQPGKQDALPRASEIEKAPTMEQNVSAEPFVAPASPSQVRRQAFYEEVQQLAAQGLSLRAIARKLDVSRVTVKRYVLADKVPVISPREYPLSRTVLAEFVRRIDQRLAEGVVSIKSLVEELRREGYVGSDARVYAYVHHWYPQGVRTQWNAPKEQAFRLSARSAVWLLVRKASKLSSEEQKMRVRLLAGSEEISLVNTLVERFTTMVRERHCEELDSWLDDASHCGIAELVNFSQGLRQDYSAVKAGLRLSWSNGPVEGQINRLKLIKRSMYGRAGMPLLRKRILCGR